MAEVLYLSLAVVPPIKYPAGLPHLIVCIGAISFVVLIRAARQIRRQEVSLGEAA